MATATVRVHGLREVQRALAKMNREAAKTLRDSLKEAAEPVAETARSRIGRYRGARTTTIRPRATMSSVFVTQGAKKVTGRRGDFGSLQMRHLVGAMSEHEDDVFEGVEDAFHKLSRAAF